MNYPFLLEFIMGSQGGTPYAFNLSVMTGFQKPNHFVCISSAPAFTDMESFLLAHESMPEQSFKKKYPTEESVLNAIEQELTMALVGRKIVDLILTDLDARQDFSNMLSNDPSGYYVDFCIKHNLISDEIKKLWGVV